MQQQPVGLLELGSNSLKFYVVRPKADGGYTIETRKVPWRIAHVFYAEGIVTQAAADEVVATLAGIVRDSRALGLTGLFCLATGVFREIPELAALSARVNAELGIRLRVISGEDEARLMARGFQAGAPGATVVGDLGGATTEWARVEAGKVRSCGSLRLGAIRLHQKLAPLSADPRRYLESGRLLCEEQLRALPAEGPARLLVTGGTARALSEVAGAPVVSAATLDAMIDTALLGGPPASLPPARAEVFLPGLVILSSLARHTGSPTLEYARTSVKEGMAQRLVSLLVKNSPNDLRSTLLLHTQIPE